MRGTGGLRRTPEREVHLAVDREVAANLAGPRAEPGTGRRSPGS